MAAQDGLARNLSWGMSWHGHTSAKITPILASKIIIMSTIPQSYTASEAGIELAIDPAFRLPTAPDRSSAEQPHLAYSAVQQSHVSTETSPAAEGHESSERTKKKNIHGPRLKRACDACSKRKIKVCHNLLYCGCSMSHALRGRQLTNSVGIVRREWAAMQPLQAD